MGNYIGIINGFSQKEKLSEVEKNQQEKEWTENKEKYEKLSLHFKKQDEENYGPEKQSIKMNVKLFKEYIYSFGKCKTEGRIIIFDSRTHSIFYTFRNLNFSDSSGEDSISSLRVMLADRIGNPFLVKKPSVFDIPFDMEFRELNGKKFIGLTFSSRNGEKVIKQEFFIREI